MNEESKSSWPPPAGVSARPAGVFSFHVCPEIDNGFGAWFHGTMVRRYQAAWEDGFRIAGRFSSLHRVRVQVRVTPVDDAGIVRCVDPYVCELFFRRKKG